MSRKITPYLHLVIYKNTFVSCIGECNCAIRGELERWSEGHRNLVQSEQAYNLWAASKSLAYKKQTVNSD